MALDLDVGSESVDLRFRKIMFLFDWTEKSSNVQILLINLLGRKINNVCTLLH